MVREIVPLSIVCVSFPRRVLRVIASAPLSNPSRPRIREDRATPIGFTHNIWYQQPLVATDLPRFLDFAINSKISQKIAQFRVLDRSGDLVRFGWF